VSGLIATDASGEYADLNFVFNPHHIEPVALVREKPHVSVIGAYLNEPVGFVLRDFRLVDDQLTNRQQFLDTGT
jgi:hypothetical protein